MKRVGYKGLLLVSFVLLFSCSQKEKTSQSDTQFWLTTADRKALLEKQENLAFANGASGNQVITVDSSKVYQSIDGFGYALTGGSAMLINTRLNSTQRDSLLRELFTTHENGIGISYIRISIGASDLDDHVFSYDDLPAGQKDPSLSKFTLDPDRVHLIPVLKQIIALQPNIKIMASPWSSPTWMKTNDLPKGGSLKPEYYSVYANYLVKYVHEMAKEGITIDAITIQNEPENPKNTPSLVMTAEEQNEFIKKHLGPAFQQAGIKTKIVLFDHNCDHPEYPITILNDAETNPFVDGSAFHMYVGEINAMSKVHDAHPDKSVYFTEQWTSGKGEFGGDLAWHIKNLIIGASRNWGRNVLEWNLAADQNFNPHTSDGGCDICQGALTISDSSVVRNVSYYIIGHASKFVPAGSERIESNLIDGLPSVAFLTPERKNVLIVLNEGKEIKTFSIQYNGKITVASLPAGAVGTFVW